LPEKLLAHQTMDPTPLNKFVPGLSAGLGEVVARMMRKSPDERYATPLLVAQALEPFENAANCFEHGKNMIQDVIDSSPQSQQFLAESAASLTKALAAPAVSLPNAQTGRTIAESAHSSQVNAAESQAAAVTPINDAGLSDPDFPFLVDLGPEPSLSEELSRAKSRLAHAFSTTAGASTTPRTPVPDTATSAGNDSVLVPWWLPMCFWGLVALMVLATVSVVILAIVRR
jgi:hypothetical protein